MPTYLPACHAETSSRLPRCPSAQAGLSSTSTRKNPLPQSPRPVNRPSQHSTPPSILTRQQLSIALVASHSLSNTLKGRTLHLPHASKATARHQPWYTCCQHRQFSASQAGASIHTHMHLYTCTLLPTLLLLLLLLLTQLNSNYAPTRACRHKFPHSDCA